MISESVYVQKHIAFLIHLNDWHATDVSEADWILSVRLDLYFIPASGTCFVTWVNYYHVVRNKIWKRKQWNKILVGIWWGMVGNWTSENKH